MLVKDLLDLLHLLLMKMLLTIVFLEFVIPKYNLYFVNNELPKLKYILIFGSFKHWYNILQNLEVVFEVSLPPPLFQAVYHHMDL